MSALVTADERFGGLPLFLLSVFTASGDFELEEDSLIPCWRELSKEQSSISKLIGGCCGSLLLDEIISIEKQAQWSQKMNNQ